VSAELTSLARKAEAVGCSTFVLPDHLIGQYAAMPPLAVVAAASERLRVGTFVLNVCLRHPAVLAQDLATLDDAAAGRLHDDRSRGSTIADSPNWLPTATVAQPPRSFAASGSTEQVCTAPASTHFRHRRFSTQISTQTGGAAELKGYISWFRP